MTDFNTKQWWINEFNAILEKSNYEAIDNPNKNENNVVVVTRGTQEPPHFIGVKPKKDGKFGLWAKREYVDALPKGTIPAWETLKGQTYHYNSIDNTAFACNVARVLAGLEVKNPISDKLQFVIEKYKENFDEVDKEERYKWKAVAWYKKHWNIEAEDFGKMVETAFGKADNLLASYNYYAYKMLVKYAEDESKIARELFRTLYDEKLPLAERCELFKDKFKDYCDRLSKKEGKPISPYQDLHAISVYLFFEYPEKYFIYKSSMYTKMRERIGFIEEKIEEKADIRSFYNYTLMCELILNEIHNDEELRKKSDNRLDDACYKDEAYHLLAMDIAYYGAKYMDDAVFGKLDNLTYWPSLDEYDPCITKEMWKQVLADPSIATPDTLSMLKKMLELGGESTCAHLAEVYGNTHAFYNITGSTFGRRVKDKYNCPDCIDTTDETKSRNRVYVVPFVGRNVKEKGVWHYSWKLRDELKEALEDMGINDIVDNTVTDIELNTILYGPPGTGKTYHTVIYAVAIIENKKLAEVAQEDYNEVLARYKEHKENGRIALTTFHQSYGYEELIEGIKPCVNEKKEVYYDVVPGVFKKFCEHKIMCKISFDEAWNTMLRDVYRQNNLIKVQREKVVKELKWDAKNEKFYDTKESLLYQYADKRSVEDFYKGTLEMGKDNGAKAQTYYNSKALCNVLKTSYGLDKEFVSNKVFIIDEINRGNISKIFGELITLIEPSKRLGADEEMTAVLPYSEKPFGVPNNVYIIGTMNTADRSIATIDTALRRRFSFVEMMPKPELFKDDIEGISIKQLLETINNRIHYLYDREHTIGHAYFKDLFKKENQNIQTLRKILKKNIFPLLQEYFYDDYDKIAQILGDSDKKTFFREINAAGLTFDEGIKYELDYEKLDCVSVEDIKKIYK